MDADIHRGVLDHAPWGAHVVSTALVGRCLYVDPGIARSTGYQLEDILMVQDCLAAQQSTVKV